MARLIDADALLDGLDENCGDLDLQYNSEYAKLVHYIDDAPTIDAKPVRHGQNVSPAHYSDEFTCSACGFSCEITELRYDDEDGFGMGADTGYEYDCKFCPDCGAKMDGGAEDEKL
jgi:hypothetical protein